MVGIALPMIAVLAGAWRDPRCSEWAASGHCSLAQSADFMRKRCPESCGAVGGADGGAGGGSGGDGRCTQWASEGFCDDPQYEAYMTQHCAGVCGGEAQLDAAEEVAEEEYDGGGAGSGAGGDQCTSWASEGYCDDPQYKAYMKQHCAGVCGGEADRQLDAAEEVAEEEYDGGGAGSGAGGDQCTSWASEGYCDDPQYKAYMKQHCAGVCASGGVPDRRLDAAEEVVDDGFDAYGGDAEFGVEEEAEAEVEPVAEGTPAEQAVDAGASAEENAGCGEWAKLGYCTAGEHVTYMEKECKRACAELEAGGGTPRTAEAASASRSQCATWARAGNCRTHAQYMRQHCDGFCDGADPGPALAELEVLPPRAGVGTLLVVALFGGALAAALRSAIAADAKISHKVARDTLGEVAEIGPGSKAGKVGRKKERQLEKLKAKGKVA